MSPGAQEPRSPGAQEPRSPGALQAVRDLPALSKKIEQPEPIELPSQGTQ